jgi:site-specific DNA-cytosine methylase
LFCGAGGLSLGFQQAGFHIAFANDINEEYANTYRLNHGGTMFFRESVEDLTTAAVYKTTGLHRTGIDILIGGPPCQGFSINAPKRSLGDDRNRLFREYGRLVLEGLRPKVIVMENVPGMVSLDGGRFIKDIYTLFQGAGYRMRHMILCAAHYGIPQERWRLFFIGTILKTADITFPEPTHYAPVRANFTGGRDLTWLPSIQNGVNTPNLFGLLLRPFTKGLDCEYVDGEIVERTLPDEPHSRIQWRLSGLIWDVSKTRPGHGRPELRSRVAAPRVRIPDVSIYAGQKPTERVPTKSPLVAIEILSPDNRYSKLMQKFEEYHAWGVRHICLVDPESRKLKIYADGTLSEVPALNIPEFAVQLTAAEIFG